MTFALFSALFPLAFLLMFVSICLGSQETIHFQAANTSMMRDPENGLHFAFFNKHNHKYLNATPVSVISVRNHKICLVACVGNYQCLSFNLEVKQDKGTLRCELLSTDIFRSSQDFINKADFAHFSIKSPCHLNLCKNGGTCVPFYNNNTHVCQCPNLYRGSECEKKILCLSKTLEELESTGINSTNTSSGVLQVYRDVSKDHEWILIARFSNKDDKNWIKSGDLWYDASAAQGNTTEPSINEDMISPAFWLVQGRELKLTRSDDSCHIPLLQTVSNCLGYRTFRAMISSFGNFRNRPWGNDNCLARCNVTYSGSYTSVIGFSQANCNGTMQDSQKIGFWCGGDDDDILDGAVMMIGGGGMECDRADHGIGVTEDNDAQFDPGCDFGDDSECSRRTDYAINLWIRQ